ncbi:hypothetical protein, partial [Variovorax beijingensis]|uniref:hypothetical protein n=1 Tax=Variovorax beijingensis TaxID=2496117 RepID=UPI003F69ECF0
CSASPSGVWMVTRRFMDGVSMRSTRSPEARRMMSQWRVSRGLPAVAFVDYFLLKRAIWPLSMRRRALRQDVSSDRNYAISMHGEARVLFRFGGFCCSCTGNLNCRKNALIRRM